MILKKSFMMSLVDLFRTCALRNWQQNYVIFVGNGLDILNAMISMTIFSSQLHKQQSIVSRLMKQSLTLSIY